MKLVRADDLSAVQAALAAALDGGPAVLSYDDELQPRRHTIAAARPEEPLEYDDIALLVHTSGTTGNPKLTLLPADALLHSARATLDRLGGPGSWSLALPLYHVAGLQVLVRSIVGGTAAIRVDSGHGPEAFIAATTKLPPGRRYTALVPAQLGWLVRGGRRAVEALASYDAVLVGGGPVTLPTLTMAQEAGIRVVTTYGMSETCGGCVYDGVALDGVDWALTDDGRIRVRGPVLARGYRLDPDLTATAFAEGWFTTQDAGERTADGRLKVVGRVDRVIITGGEKVALDSVWSSLATHPAVGDLAVFGVDDEDWGQRVVAAVVLTDTSVNPEDLRQRVAESHGRVSKPKQMLVLDALPTIGPGKADLVALRTLAQAEWRP